MKIDFEVSESSPMYQNINVLTYFDLGINLWSVFHRYYGPRAQYPAQGDFGDGAATNWHFREVCSSQHPQKILRPAKAIFFGRKKIGFMQIRSLSKKLHGRQQPRCEGGSSLSNFLAYTQLDEMPHI